MLCFYNRYNTISLPIFSSQKKLAGYNVKSMIMLFTDAALMVVVVEMVAMALCQPTAALESILCS